MTHEEKLAKRREYMRAYREANREKVRAENRNWKAANRERNREINRQSYERTKDANRDKNRAQCRDYYVNNRPAMLAKNRAWAADNPEMIRDRRSNMLRNLGVKPEHAHLIPESLIDAKRLQLRIKRLCKETTQ